MALSSQFESSAVSDGAHHEPQRRIFSDRFARRSVLARAPEEHPLPRTELGEQRFGLGRQRLGLLIAAAADIHAAGEVHEP